MHSYCIERSVKLYCFVQTSTSRAGGGQIDFLKHNPDLCFDLYLMSESIHQSYYISSFFHFLPSRPLVSGWRNDENLPAMALWNGKALDGLQPIISHLLILF